MSPARAVRFGRVLGLALCLVIAFAAAPPVVLADEAIGGALRSMQSERRAAILALRNGDRARARIILRRISARWELDTAEVPLIRREAEPYLGEAMQQLDEALLSITTLIDNADTATAIAQLEDLPDIFDPWRGTRRGRVLMDCLDLFSRHWERLVLVTAGSNGAVAQRLAEAASQSRSLLALCPGPAGPGIASAFAAFHARFESSLQRLEDALNRGDDAAARHLLDEQRRLERSISHRFR